MGDDQSPQRYLLQNCSLSGSGTAVKGQHIFDPRTGLAGVLRNRAWALANTAAESDALSTAGMILTEGEITAILASHETWLVFLQDNQSGRALGKRAVPATAIA